jgi:hypothetical protein
MNRRALSLLALALSFACAASALASNKVNPQPASGPQASSAAEPAASPASSGAGEVHAQGGQAAQPQGTQPGQPVQNPTASAPPAERPLTPMQAEIKQVLEDEKTAVAELETRFTQTTDQAAALEIQKKIQETKLGTELKVLGIQAGFARAEGRTAVAEQLEAAIREMTTPKAPGQPVERPVPQAAPKSGNQ